MSLLSSEVVLFCGFAACALCPTLLHQSSRKSKLKCNLSRFAVEGATQDNTNEAVFNVTVFSVTKSKGMHSRITDVGLRGRSIRVKNLPCLCCLFYLLYY